MGKLIALYDDNHITIDGRTNVSFTEDVLKRYEAYGWHVQHVADGNTDVNAIAKAIEAAKAITDKPSIIKVTTTIGYGSPNKSDTAGVHGAPLGEEEATLTRQQLGWDYGPLRYPKRPMTNTVRPSSVAPASKLSGTRPWPATAASTPAKPLNSSACCAASCPRDGTRICPPTPPMTRAWPPASTPRSAWCSAPTCLS